MWIRCYGNSGSYSKCSQTQNRKEEYSSGRAVSAAMLPPKSIRRKEKRAPILFSPAGRCLHSCFVFSLQEAGGSLSLEASVALAVFVICMTAVLQFGNVMYELPRFSNALAETGEEMAITMYASEFTEDEAPLPAVFSLAYAEGRIRSRIGNTPSVNTISLLLSALPDEENQVDLVMIYRIRSPVGMISMPWVFFLQRACVRGWVGREGSGGSAGSGSSGEDPSRTTVYVTENGSVYHLSRECSHIRLDIKTVSREELQTARNTDGEIYRPCEHCGKAAGEFVYISADGNRYHSSLECSGLKRTVKETTLSEIGEMHVCSRCGGNHG